MEECQRCHEIDEDRRTISMACFYDMDELGLPFKQELMKSVLNDDSRRLYTLKVCRQCRGSWMAAQINWFHGVDAIEDSPGTGIYIREHGAVKEITEEEWYNRNPMKPNEYRSYADKLVNDIIMDEVIS